MVTGDLFLAVVLWPQHKNKWNSCLAQLYLRGRGEPTCHPCSITGMMQDNHLLQLGVTWDIYLRELLCHREEILSGMMIFFSESVVFHLVFWLSSLLCCFGLCLCLGLFCLGFGSHLAVCFSPVLEQREKIADRRQNVLMNVRASSVHGMSSKKKLVLLFFSPSFPLPILRPSMAGMDDDVWRNGFLIAGCVRRLMGDGFGWPTTVSALEFFTAWIRHWFYAAMMDC